MAGPGGKMPSGHLAGTVVRMKGSSAYHIPMTSKPRRAAQSPIKSRSMNCVRTHGRRTFSPDCTGALKSPISLP